MSSFASLAQHHGSKQHSGRWLWQHLWQGFCHTPAGLLHSQPMQQPSSPLKHSCCPPVRPIPCSQQLGHSSAIFQQHYLGRAVPPRGPLPAAHSSITQRHLGLHVALLSSTQHHGPVRQAYKGLGHAQPTHTSHPCNPYAPQQLLGQHHLGHVLMHGPTPLLILCSNPQPTKQCFFNLGMHSHALDPWPARVQSTPPLLPRHSRIKAVTLALQWTTLVALTRPLS
jgi:hypothetical protein